MRLARFVTFLLRAALLVAAGLATLAGLERTPVANEAVRALGPGGDWRVSSPAALYNSGDYFTRLGLAHITAVARQDLATRDHSQIAPGVQEATFLLRQAVARSPADALAWAGLGLAALLGRDAKEAERALRTSWRLAPYNAGLSTLRLSAFDFIDPASVEPDILENVARDIRVARREAPKTLTLMVETSVNISALVDRIDQGPFP